MDARGWEFGQIVTADETLRGQLSQAFSMSVAPLNQLDTSLVSLVAAPGQTRDEAWRAACDAVYDSHRGLTMVLRHPIDVEPAVDVVGSLEIDGKSLPLVPDVSTALVMAQHPAARVAGRVLKKKAH